MLCKYNTSCANTIRLVQIQYVLYEYNTCCANTIRVVQIQYVLCEYNTCIQIQNVFVASGDLHVLSSDNCTYNADQKAVGVDDFRKIPTGVNGLEDRMSVLWQNAVVS